MNLLENYNKALQELYDHVGFVENWVVCPIDDKTNKYWDLDNYNCYYADTVEKLRSEDEDYYQDEIYKQVFYPKWVYEGERYTMVMCDPHVDGMKWFRVFDNSKRINL